MAKDVLVTTNDTNNTNGDFCSSSLVESLWSDFEELWYFFEAFVSFCLKIIESLKQKDTKVTK